MKVKEHDAAIATTVKELHKMKKHAERHAHYYEQRAKRLSDNITLLERFIQRKRRKIKSDDTDDVNDARDTGFLDYNDKKIKIGDKVEIITKGTSCSTEGKVVSIKNKRLEICDSSGKKITRASHNLVVQEQDDLEYADSETEMDFETYWGITEEVRFYRELL